MSPDSADPEFAGREFVKHRDSADPEFVKHRDVVFSVAYNILGTVADAEDVVHDSYLRWREAAARPHAAPIANPRAYLARIAATQALNSARTVSRRREVYVGPWLPEPLATPHASVSGAHSGGGEEVPEDPADIVERSEHVSMALLVVLQSLSAEERVAFVLRDVFDVDYDEISAALGTNNAGTRQLVHRARTRVHEQRPRFTVSAADHRRAVERFAQAALNGDYAALIEALSPDVVFTSDGGGKVTAARRPVVGSDNVARAILGLLQRHPEAQIVPIVANGELAFASIEAGAVTGVFQFEVAGDHIVAMFIMRNPDKLAHVSVG